MTFTDEMYGVINDVPLSPDEMDWVTSFVNDAEQREKLKELFMLVFKQQLESISQEMDKLKPDQIPEDFNPLTVAGDASLASLVAIARVAGIVSERQRNTALAEQLGEPYGGGDFGRL